MNIFTRASIAGVILIAGAGGLWYLNDTAPVGPIQGGPIQGGPVQGGPNAGNTGAVAGSGNGQTQQSGASTGNRAGQSGGNRGGRGGRPAPLVVASEVTELLINSRLKAVGSGTAQASVSVVPLTGGILTDVLVSTGQQVEANEILATLDSEEQEIARDRAARAAEEAQADAIRLDRLLRTQTTTQVELNRALAARSDARLALRDAELRLKRRTLTAPIAGVVGFVSLDRGNYIDPQTQLLTIDDRSNLIVDFWVPERFANQVVIGQRVMAVALANPGTRYDGVITGVGSRIESSSRTLQVKALVDNASDELRPGMSFELQLNFPGEKYPAVDPLAIQWDSTGSYVWQLNDDKVQKVAATIIQRNPESVLIDADLQPGDKVISEGLLSLRQGATVRVQGNQSNGGQNSGGRAKQASESGRETATKAKSSSES